MPLYLYEHPETKEVVEVVQGMNDDHTYHEWPEGEAKPSYEIRTLLELLEIMELANSLRRG